MIASSLPILRTFYARGVRYMTLTHWQTTRWADAATDAPRHGGLTAVRARGRPRDEPARDARRPQPRRAGDDGRGARCRRGAGRLLALGRLAVTDHPRNVPDEILRRVPGNGGVVMAVFLSGFVSAEVARHASHAGARGRVRARTRTPPPRPARRRRGSRRTRAPADDASARSPTTSTTSREVAGVDHVGIGSDFDGGEPLPDGSRTCPASRTCSPSCSAAATPTMTSAAIAGGNILRVMRGAEAVARDSRPTPRHPRRRSRSSTRRPDSPG